MDGHNYTVISKTKLQLVNTLIMLYVAEFYTAFGTIPVKVNLFLLTNLRQHAPNFLTVRSLFGIIESAKASNF